MALTQKLMDDLDKEAVEKFKRKAQILHTNMPNTVEENYLFLR